MWFIRVEILFQLLCLLCIRAEWLNGFSLHTKKEQNVFSRWTTRTITGYTLPLCGKQYQWQALGMHKSKSNK